ERSPGQNRRYPYHIRRRRREKQTHHACRGGEHQNCSGGVSRLNHEHNGYFSVPTTDELAAILVAMGCPQEKSPEMARQLEKRAGQLADKKDKTREEALAHLLGLMRQGWAAKEKGS